MAFLHTFYTTLLIHFILHYSYILYYITHTFYTTLLIHFILHYSYILYYITHTFYTTLLIHFILHYSYILYYITHTFYTTLLIHFILHYSYILYYITHAKHVISEVCICMFFILFVLHCSIFYILHCSHLVTLTSLLWVNKQWVSTLPTIMSEWTHWLTFSTTLRSLLSPHGLWSTCASESSQLVSMPLLL